MSTTRIYIVKGGAGYRLVEATSKAQAIWHCVHGLFEAGPATPKALANLMADGVSVEKASSLLTKKLDTHADAAT